jgi:hypothetical protein
MLTTTVAAGVLATIALPASAQTPIVLEDQKLTASDASDGDLFGGGLALEGDLAVAGADHFHIQDNDPNTPVEIGAGAAYVFRRTGTTWSEEAILTPDDHGLTDGFGFATAISGNVIAVSAPWSPAPNRGAVYVFRHDGTTWVQEAKLTPDAWQGWGFGLALDGDVLAIGSTANPAAATSGGAVHIFRYDGASWNEEAVLTASDAIANGHLGRPVWMDGDTVVAGSWPGNAAYVFRYDGTTWSEEAKLTGPDTVAGDRFSGDISVDRDLIFVGARFNDHVATNAGSAYAFRRTGSTWSFEAQLNPSDAEAHDSFGHAVSVCRNVAVVANVADDDSGLASGSAYVYVFDGTDWIETAKLLASDGDPRDLLGGGVAACESALLSAGRDDDEGVNTGAVYYYAFPDGDGDGLNDYHELFFGTDPAVADTDSDGLLDGTEIDMAEGGPCPDALDPDSDGDTLLDGDEVALGTNSCNADTDGDTVPDNEDDLPTVPGSSGLIEADLRAVCGTIEALDLSLIDAKNNNARAGRRNAMCNKLNAAANAVAAGDYDEALDQLASLRAKLDGEAKPKDWMFDGPARDAIVLDIDIAVALLELF